MCSEITNKIYINIVNNMDPYWSIITMSDILWKLDIDSAGLKHVADTEQ